jgi:predicted AlkP superfamily phosphohydrolase/phosphomutase
MGFFRQSKSRVVVLGLDGTPYTLLERWAQEGKLPHIAKLLKQGTLARMTTSLPDISSVAWTSFMCGKNPGKHNVYGFMDRCDDSYDIYFPNFRSIRGTTLWEYLGNRGKHLVALNVPTTYPAKPVSGVMVSGFVALEFDKAVYPASLIPTLKEMDYRIDVDYQKARTDPDGFFEDLFYTHERRTQAILHLMKKEPWDLFVAVFTGTDRLQHFFWEHMEMQDSQYGTQFLKYYERVDQSVGQIVDEVGQDAHLLMLSDHGFCLLKKEVYLNYYLRQRGYLKFKKDSPESLVDIHPDTQAYCLDPSRIYIHLKGREPQGSVDPGEEYMKLRDQLASEFSNLADEVTGEKMIQKVWTREELYQGPFYHRAPDLVLQARYGYDLKGSFTRNSFTGRGALTGMHTYDDAMFYIRGYELDHRPVSIFDVMPTILKLMGEESPPDLDGKALI